MDTTQTKVASLQTELTVKEGALQATEAERANLQDSFAKSQSQVRLFLFYFIFLCICSQKVTEVILHFEE